MHQSCSCLLTGYSRSGRPTAPQSYRAGADWGVHRAPWRPVPRRVALSIATYFLAHTSSVLPFRTSQASLTQGSGQPPGELVCPRAKSRSNLCQGAKQPAISFLHNPDEDVVAARHAATLLLFGTGETPMR